MSRFPAILMLSCACLLTSCRQEIGSDELEKEHKAIREARELVQQQEVVAAESVLLEALREEPDLALAHLQLGMIYQSQEDSVAAIYHFQSYLSARPDGEKSNILRQVIEDERRRLADQVTRSETTSTSGMSSGDQDLAQQLSDAEQRIAELEVSLQQARFQAEGLPASPPPEWAEERLALLEEIRSLRQRTGRTETAAEPAAPVSGRTYTVQRGDTLTSIAKKVYGSGSAHVKIFEANQDVIPNKNVLSPGVVIVLP